MVFYCYTEFSWFDDISELSPVSWFSLSFPESITEKDKRMLQNTMAYGEEGAAMIEETPPPRKPQKEVQSEVEIDRFDEG